MKSPRLLLILGGAVGVALAVCVLANWNTVSLLLAFAAAERRPDLLSDAKWRSAASAVKFDRRFGPGAQEGDLISWLRANRFQVDQPHGQAGRTIRSLPCNEQLEVRWTSDGAGKIRAARAEVFESGCL